MIVKFYEFIRFADGIEDPNEEVKDEEIDQRPLNKKSFILKTKCVDMLIELLMNEQIFKIGELVDHVISILIRITNSIYVPAPKDQKKKDVKSVPALTNESLTIKEHLLKKIHLKKLLVVHYRL